MDSSTDVTELEGQFWNDPKSSSVCHLTFLNALSLPSFPLTYFKMDGKILIWKVKFLLDKERLMLKFKRILNKIRLIVFKTSDTLI